MIVLGSLEIKKNEIFQMCTRSRVHSRVAEYSRVVNLKFIARPSDEPTGHEILVEVFWKRCCSEFTAA